MIEAFENPSNGDIRALLGRITTIAVVGLSATSRRPSHGVADAMQSFGYRIIPVNPNADRVLGEQAYPDLRSVPLNIDLVDVFRAPEHVSGIVDECIALALSALWLQDGVVDEDAALRARAAGIEVVMDRCIYRDYVRLM